VKVVFAKGHGEGGVFENILNGEGVIVVVERDYIKNRFPFNGQKMRLHKHCEVGDIERSDESGGVIGNHPSPFIPIKKSLWIRGPTVNNSQATNKIHSG
jgi:hypothetical protein